MKPITSQIHWSRLSGEAFVDNRYSRKHDWQFDGGLQVPASSSPQVVREPLSDPSAIDPEEAFVAALSSCHMLWFLSIAAKRGFVVEEYTDSATGDMATNDDGKIAISVVTLRPDVIFGDETQPAVDEIAAMHHEAHEECFIASSVKTEVRCEPVPGN